MPNARLDQALERLREQGRKALIVYITAGHPDLETTKTMIPALFEAGADVIELGVPFSDPLADGPTIQTAAQHALAQGVTLGDVLSLVKTLRDQGESRPLACLCYVNTLLAYGLLKEPQPLADAGFDAVIVPDIPSIERAPYEAGFQAAGLHLIPFLTPTSTQAQFDDVAAGRGGFIYCVSVTGVTGARSSLPASTRALLQKARERCRRPVAVGFGIADATTAAAMAEVADGVIVGSAVVQRITDAVAGGGDPVRAAAAFVRSLREALDVQADA